MTVAESGAAGISETALPAFGDLRLPVLLLHVGRVDRPQLDRLGAAADRHLVDVDEVVDAASVSASFVESAR